MHQQQKMQLQTQYHPHGLTGGIIALSNPSNQNFIQKGVIKKKLQGKNNINSPTGVKQNGMLAALHPSGTMHVTGVGNTNSSTISVGMMSTDFKSTMKHNSSNNSIHSHGGNKKAMVTTIRKPTDLNANKIAKGSGSSYMSPYSQKIAAKTIN